MRFLTFVIAAVVSWASVFCRPQAVLQPALSGTRSLDGGALFETTTTAKPQIPIIRHINRVNNDGSYTFGYESGDGSYRVETRGLDGLIQGRYGYIDELGARKEVDYVAGSATGYEPRGAGITVPPRPPPRPPGQQFVDYDDGSWTTPAPVRSRVSAQRQQSRPQAVQQAPQPQFQAPPPPPPTQAPPPPPPPPPAVEFQPSITITQPRPQPEHQFQRTFRPVPSAALPPRPNFDFARPAPAASDFARPAPAASDFARPAPVPQASFHSQQSQTGGAGGASPIESFLRSQISSQQQPQQLPQQQQLF